MKRVSSWSHVDKEKCSAAGAKRTRSQPPRASKLGNALADIDLDFCVSEDSASESDQPLSSSTSSSSAGSPASGGAASSSSHMSASASCLSFASASASSSQTYPVAPQAAVCAFCGLRAYPAKVKEAPSSSGDKMDDELIGPFGPARNAAWVHTSCGAWAPLIEYDSPEQSVGCFTDKSVLSDLKRTKRCQRVCCSKILLCARFHAGLIARYVAKWVRP